MPGLFGSIELTADAQNIRRREAALNRMAETLRFRPDDAVDTHLDPEARFAVGRIGPAHARLEAWPARRGEAQVFAFGHPFIGGGDHGLAGQYIALQADGAGASLQTDRRGYLRAFHTVWDGAVWFAPEIKALLAVRPDIPPLDLGAIGTFLVSGMTHHGATFFEAITRLPGGFRLTVERGAPEKEEYFRFLPGSRARPARQRSGMRDDLIALLVGAARRNLDGDAAAVLFLSGGTDARTILASLRRAGCTAPSTVTWGDGESGPGSDVAVARAIAESLGLDHREMRRDWSDAIAAFERANALLDGHSGMALEHAPELGVIERIGALGYDRCLRGDEAFGWQEMSYGLEHSWRAVGLRRLSEATDAQALIAPGARRAAIEASEATFDAIRDRYGDLVPNQAKDGLYFDTRLANYLQPANYWRQTVFDERNPLLDDDILAFLAEVPEELRIDKALFRDATSVLTRDWPDIPFADGSKLDPFMDQMRPGAPMRLHAEAEAADVESGIWDLIDRPAFATLLAKLGRSTSAAVEQRGRRRRLLRSARHAMGAISGRMAQRAAIRLKRGQVREDMLASRVLVLKDWHDRFITARRAAAEKRPR